MSVVINDLIDTLERIVKLRPADAVRRIVVYIGPCPIERGRLRLYAGEDGQDGVAVAEDGDGSRVGSEWVGSRVQGDGRPCRLLLLLLLLLEVVVVVIVLLVL